MIQMRLRRYKDSARADGYYRPIHALQIAHDSKQLEAH